MKHFCDASCEANMSASNAIDHVIVDLDELPERERLAGIIDRASGIVAELDAIIKDEGF